MTLLAHGVAQEDARYERLEKAANLIRQGDLVRAEAELHLVLEKQPHDANAMNLLGVVRAQQQRRREAEQLFLRALRQSPTLTGAYINLGRLYLDEHNDERARWAYSEAARLTPENPDIAYQLATLYAAAGNFAQAIAFLERIPQSSWRFEELYLATKCYLNLGLSDKALPIINSVIRSEALTANEAAAFAAVLIKANLPDEANSLLETALSKEPNSFALLYQLGVGYSQKKDWPKAEEYYTRALALNPGSVATLRDLARLARTRGELEKALSYLVQARKLAPDDTSVLYDFGVVAFSMNLVLDALPIAEKLLQKEPNNPAYVHLLAVTRFRHDEKEAAEKLLRHYIQLRPQDTLGYYLLGVTLFTVKRYQEARQSFQQSLAFATNSDSEYMLGLIAENEGDKVTAVKWLERVGQSSASYPAAQTLLGVVYAEQNNISSARTTLERAIQLNPQDLRAHYQLGLVYAKLGEKILAQQMLAIADRLREEQRNQEVVSFKLIDPPQ